MRGNSHNPEGTHPSYSDLTTLATSTLASRLTHHHDISPSHRVVPRLPRFNVFPMLDLIAGASGKALPRLSRSSDRMTCWSRHVEEDYRR